MKSNIYRLTHNRISQIIFITFLVFPIVEVIQLLIDRYQFGTDYHPAFASFLSGSSQGHATQMLLLWFLPIYFLLMGTDTPIQDFETGYRNVLISKVGKKKYILTKYFTAFLISSLVMLVALFINFLFVYIFFKNGTFMAGLEQVQLDNNILFNFSINHPYSASTIFALVAVLLAGFIGVMCTSVSLFFLNRKFAYAAAFFIWFLFVIKGNSVMFLLQPFAEYGLTVLIPILMQVLLVLILVPVLVFIYEVKFNDN